MDAQMIIATVRSGSVPHDWNVWPLNVQHVRRGLFGWIGITAVGFLLLISAAMATIPGNFEHGAGGVFFTTLILGILAGLAFGGLGIALFDVWRLVHADEFYIIMTPDDFVLAEPRRTVHVPMENVSYITLRGWQTQQQQAAEELRGMGSASGRTPIASAVRITPFVRPRRPRTSSSLAFVDSRDNSTVVVATDASFEDLFVLEQVLNDHASAKQRSRMA